MSTLCVVFLRDPSPISHIFDCVYSACGILVLDVAGCTSGTLYSTLVCQGSFGKCRYVKNGGVVQLDCEGDGVCHPFYGEHDIVRLPATADETRRVSELCEACCKLRRGYNLLDKCLSIVSPIVQLDDNVDIFSAKTLHVAQAVLLILRAALDPDNALCEPLRALNSRTVYSTQLHRVLMDTPYFV